MAHHRRTDLEYDIRQLLKIRERSYGTQAARKAILLLCVAQLTTPTTKGGLGFMQLRGWQLGQKHVNRLVRRWVDEGVQVGTIENRLAALRWWDRKVHRVPVLPARNAVYGLGERPRVPRVSKALVITEADLAAVQDARVRMSLALVQAFGLRREEAIKIRPHEADQGTFLVLRNTWCKGGRSRAIPIQTATQRTVLEQAKAMTRPGEALIPDDATYVQQQRRYQYRRRQAGLGKPHGARHAYAQAQYETYSGLPAPLHGGPALTAMTPEQREAHEVARLLVSAELGHNRPQITTTYIGTTPRT